MMPALRGTGIYRGDSHAVGRDSNASCTSPCGRIAPLTLIVIIIIIVSSLDPFSRALDVLRCRDLVDVRSLLAG